MKYLGAAALAVMGTLALSTGRARRSSAMRMGTAGGSKNGTNTHRRSNSSFTMTIGSGLTPIRLGIGGASLA